MGAKHGMLTLQHTGAMMRRRRGGDLVFWLSAVTVRRNNRQGGRAVESWFPDMPDRLSAAHSRRAAARNGVVQMSSSCGMRSAREVHLEIRLPW